MNRLVLFILLLMFWVSLTWPADPGPPFLQDCGTGVVAALLVTWIMGHRRNRGIPSEHKKTPDD